MFTAAVDDGIIVRNPLRLKSVQWPSPEYPEAVPWTPGQIAAVAGELPARYEALPYLGAASGQRQGEMFGLAVSDLDFLRRNVHVALQLKLVRGKLVFGPIKNKKIRDVPLTDEVIPVLSEHIRRFPPVEVTLPWVKPDGKPVTRRLVFTNSRGGPIIRQGFNLTWQRAWRKAGVPDRGRKNGMHVTRHTFATELLSNGVSLAKVAAYLGDTKEMVLATYAHFLPADESRARDVMGAFFRACAPDMPGGQRPDAVEPGQTAVL